jgi:4'-phosphopantetheinyl transferase EntD
MRNIHFCVKEAAYKATHPIDGVFLEHRDVEVCLASSVALTISGRNLRIQTIAKPRLVALALLSS